MSEDTYTYNSDHPLQFLQEISEDYANSQFKKSDSDIILKYAEKTLGKIPNIDSYINRQFGDPYLKEDEGDNEFIYTFKWKCTNDVELMKKWFHLLYKLGGNPNIKNMKGKNAFDVCRERMLEEGYEEEDVSEFLNSL
jgi:hypothetical protein